MVAIGVPVNPAGKWRSSTFAISFGWALADKMLGASTSTAFERLSVFALWVASASEALSRSEDSSGVSFPCNECIHIVMGKMIALAEEHSSAMPFPFKEAKALSAPAESSHWLPCKTSPHSLCSLVNPEDGLRFVLLWDL